MWHSSTHQCSSAKQTWRRGFKVEDGDKCRVCKQKKFLPPFFLTRRVSGRGYDAESALKLSRKIHHKIGLMYGENGGQLNFLITPSPASLILWGTVYHRHNQGVGEISPPKMPKNTFLTNMCNFFLPRGQNIARGAGRGGGLQRPFRGQKSPSP